MQRPPRWIARILPSGAFSCGRVPERQSDDAYNPKLLDYKRKVCIVRRYTGEDYSNTTSQHVYWENQFSGEILGSVPPSERENSLDILEGICQAKRNPDRDLTKEGKYGTQNFGSEGEVEGSVPLGLSTVPYSRIVRRQGLKGITRNGRTTVREGCYLLQKRYSLKGIGFYTLTLPHRGDDLKVIARNWNKVVHRFFEELAREYSRHGCHLEYVSVTEIQEKRFTRMGEVAPHLHYVANSKRGKEYILTPGDIRGIFRRVCERIIPTGYCFDSSENCQVVRKDAGRYLSKYFSKGGKILNEIAAIDESLVPRSWYKVCRTVKTDISQSTSVLYDAEAWNFIYTVRDAVADKLPGYSIEEVYIQREQNVEMLVGYYGYVPP